MRFNERELKRIDEFLHKNPFLDFSTLARLAISNFIENPSLQVKPVAPEVHVKKIEQKGKDRLAN